MAQLSESRAAGQSGHIADTNALHERYNAADTFDFGVQYVHPDGADANAGFSPLAPKATIAAAYGDLPDDGTYGGGTILLASGQRHDIGDALALDRRKPVSIQGFGRARRNRGATADPSNNARIYSSTASTEMINFALPASFYNTYGFEFKNLDIEVPEAVGVVVFEGDAVNMVNIDNCGFFHEQGDTNQFKFIVANTHHFGDTLGDDASWWRVTNCYSRGAELVHAVGFSSNQFVIRDNVCFGQNLAATDPFIYLEKGHRHVVADNNLEGSNVGIHLVGSWSCEVRGNSGEGTDPMVILEDSNANIVSDLGIVSPSIVKVQVRITGTSGNNIITAAGATVLSNLYVEAVDDQSTQDANWIITPSTSKGRSVIELPGLKMAETLEGVVRGKVGDVGVQYGVTGPEMFFKAGNDHSNDAWTQPTQAFARSSAQTATNQHYYIVSNATTITLDDNADRSGQSYEFVRNDVTNAAIVLCGGSDTFSDGNTQQSIDTDGGYLKVTSLGDGTWQIIITQGTVSGSTP